MAPNIDMMEDNKNEMIQDITKTVPYVDESIGSKPMEGKTTLLTVNFDSILGSVEIRAENESMFNADFYGIITYEQEEEFNNENNITIKTLLQQLLLDDEYIDRDHSIRYTILLTRKKSHLVNKHQKYMELCLFTENTEDQNSQKVGILIINMRSKQQKSRTGIVYDQIMLLHYDKSHTLPYDHIPQELKEEFNLHKEHKIKEMTPETLSNDHTLDSQDELGAQIPQQKMPIDKPPVVMEENNNDSIEYVSSETDVGSTTTQQTAEEISETEKSNTGIKSIQKESEVEKESDNEEEKMKDESDSESSEYDQPSEDEKVVVNDLLNSDSSSDSDDSDASDNEESMEESAKKIKETVEEMLEDSDNAQVDNDSMEDDDEDDDEIDDDIDQDMEDDSDDSSSDELEVEDSMEDDDSEDSQKEDDKEIVVDSSDEEKEVGEEKEEGEVKDEENQEETTIPQNDGMNEDGMNEENYDNAAVTQTIMQDLNDSDDDQEFNPEQESSDDFESDSDFEEDSLHPERPERIVRIYLLLRSNTLFQQCHRLPAREATDDELCYVHTNEYIHAVDTFHSSGGYSGLNYERGDVYINKYTHKVARIAAGSVCALTESVCKGDLQNGFAIVRSPGHHAEREKAMGFCIYSNIAIAAKLAKEKYHKRVLVVDWDVHHGNGTQNALYDDDEILFISVHRGGQDFYPFDSGYMDEVGTAPGYNINVAFPKSYYSRDLIAAFSEIVLPVAHEFNPDIVLVSAGFDAVEGDRWGNSHVAPETFGVLTRMLSTVASGKLVLALEGGYNLNETAKSVSHCIQVLLGENPIYPNTHDDPPLQKSVLDEVKLKHCQYWSCLNPPVNNSTMGRIISNQEEDFKNEFMKNKKWRKEIVNKYGKRVVDRLTKDANKRKKLSVGSSISSVMTESGSGDAFFALASMYYNGGEPLNMVDYQKAYHFAKLASDYYNPEGMRLLGLLYRKGFFLDQNDRQAYFWFKKAVQYGSVNAINNLAFMYMTGLGTAQSHKKGVLLFKKGCEYNLADSFYNLAQCYQMGTGVPKNIELANYYLSMVSST